MVTQFAPCGTLVPQLFVSLKLVPCVEMLMLPSAPVPVFISVTVCGELVVPVA